MEVIEVMFSSGLVEYAEFQGTKQVWLQHYRSLKKVRKLQEKCQKRCLMH